MTGGGGVCPSRQLTTWLTPRSEDSIVMTHPKSGHSFLTCFTFDLASVCVRVLMFPIQRPLVRPAHPEMMGIVKCKRRSATVLCSSPCPQRVLVRIVFCLGHIRSLSSLSCVQVGQFHVGFNRHRVLICRMYKGKESKIKPYTEINKSSNHKTNAAVKTDVLSTSCASCNVLL